MHMIANVFHNDFVIAERRGRQHYLRWIYGGWLLIQAFFILDHDGLVHSGVSWRSKMLAGSVHLLDVYLVQQLVLMILVVPALAGGAVADEKSRGTLQHLLTTEISAGQFLVGKLLSRTAQVFWLFLPGLPLIGALGGLVGLDAATLLSLVAVQAIPVASLVAVSLLASVWCRTTRDTVITVDAAGIAGYALMQQVGGPLRLFDPMFVLGPLSESDDLSVSISVGQRMLGSIAAWSSLGAVSLAVAVWRLRPAYQRQLESSRVFEKPRRVLWPRPPVGKNPVQWREQYVDGLTPVRALRAVPRPLALLGVFVLSCVITGGLLYSHQSRPDALLRLPHILWVADFRSLTALFDNGVTWAFLVQTSVVMFLASLLVGVRCSGAIVGEREKQTWEALLTTPLTERELVRGKYWAVIGAACKFLAAYAIPAIFGSVLTWSLAPLFTVVGLGITVLAMCSFGAVGLMCSVQAKTSWRGLLSTLVLGYIGGAAISILPFGVFMIFLLVPHLCLASAQKWIAQRDRVRRWEYSRPRPLSSRARLGQR
jgi:ABC-type transport system involved in multi-copper enzyme maturation permease subunit